MNLDIQFLLNVTQAILMIPFLHLINQYIFKYFAKKHEFFSFKMMNLLFVYHLLFGAAYYIYAIFNRSDSKRYFSVPSREGAEWLDFLGTGTTFIDFLSYPFLKIGFSYEMMMLLFTYIGYLGFVFAYLFFKENISLNIKVFRKIDLLTLILFLPNMHFWTASLGKGAPIFLGLMMFAYAIRNPQNRSLALIVGSLLVLCIRPHIFLLMALGTFVGVVSGNKWITWKHKLAAATMIMACILMFQNQILSVVHLENSDNIIADFLEFTASRSAKLDNAGSGIDMNNYSLPGKFFAFWFRPLFFDAPGILGVIVSIENLIYLLLFAKIFRLKFIKFIKVAPVNVKMSFVLFFLTSFAMTFVMSNLGIIIRQKSMIMYFLFFVIYYYLAHEKGLTVKLETATHKESLPKAA